MPFDPIPAERCVEALVVDKVLEILGPHGEHWIQHCVTDHCGNRCLMGAVIYARQKLGVKGDRTIALIFEAIFGAPPKPRIKQSFLIEAFNDGIDRKFEQIDLVLRTARTIAGLRYAPSAAKFINDTAKLEH